MFDKAHERYKWLKGQLELDGEYLHLMEKLRINQPAFQAALDTLPPEHRESILEHLGILGELSDRTAEICCYMP